MLKTLPKLNQAVDVEQSGHDSDFGVNNALRSEGMETSSPRTPVKRPSVEDRLHLLKQRSLSLKNDLKTMRAGSQMQSGVVRPEGSLTENLLKHLTVGSRDSLNLMIGVFEFHHYDKTLLTNYISNKSPDNLKALEIQIKNLSVEAARAAFQ